ncbi:MAG: hypothetical protein FMNOHCHN_03792 [Ignavibacteriaceae bacterium]|nr:hypothetical protein [Ignavibacteriaceae bacterium]
MNEKLAKLADMLISGLEKGVELMPELSQEILTYYTYEHLIAIAALSVLIGLCIKGIRSLSKAASKGCEAADGMCFVLGIMVLAFTTLIMCNTLDLVKIKTAPKLFIIQKIKRL